MPRQLILDFSFITCRIHVETLIEPFTRIIVVEYVTCWCTFMNRLLKGKDSGATSQAYLSKLAITQYKKKATDKEPMNMCSWMFNVLI